jgi:endo-1,4-beta-xylanase
MNRRTMLGGMAAVAVATAARPVRGETRRDFAVSSDAPLREQAAAKGLLYGAFGSSYYRDFSENLPLQEAFLRECGVMVTGFFWGITRPGPTEFNFEHTDRFMALAQERQIPFRGHPLVWNQLNSRWVMDFLGDPNVDKGEAERVMTTHIDTVMRRYRGQVHSWDVVNEGVNPEQGREDGLAITPWLTALGPDYIERAFWAAAEADPDAILVYNEARLDYDIPTSEARRYGVLKLLERLRSRDVPVRALGVQAHLGGHLRHQINGQKIQRFLRDVADLGLDIFISELDVKDTELTADVNERDRIVAGIYEDYLNIVLQEPAVKVVVTWGITDAATWYAEATPRADGLPVRPLPLDANFQRKLAWNGMARAFERAPQRDPLGT